MNNFTRQLTSDPLWPKLCIRENQINYVDGFGCTTSSYNNVTMLIEKKLPLRQDTSQEAVNAVMKSLAS